MSLIYAGIDEAGYGPMLGPLVVSAAVFRVERWAEGDPPPDLWESLTDAICRAPARGETRIPVADSKRLKLPNTSVRRHPLTHLERGVLAWLASADRTDEPRPATDTCLHTRCGHEVDTPPAWYGGEPIDLPLASDAGSLRIDAATIRKACRSAGIELLALRTCIVGEAEFNELVRTGGGKGATTAHAAARLIGGIDRRWGPNSSEPADVRVVLDRHGGRTDYRGILERALHGRAVDEIERTPRASVYRCGRLGVIAQPEAETHHMPVALASMAAKLLRELAMIRFNRYWAARVQRSGAAEIKPTAGYVQDARRWLADMDGVIEHHERAEMIRIA